MGIKGKEQKAPLNDPRTPEEILADDLPAADEPDATEKTAIRFALAITKSHSLLSVNYYGLIVRLQWDIDSHVLLIMLHKSNLHTVDIPFSI